MDAVSLVQGELELVEESNYYPFGLKHNGYNNSISSNGNATAQKFKYNGVEFEESLGLNLYEMGVRSYDPAIARFTSMDPITHWDNSPYVSFDNNPVFWADPSGANSIYNWDTGQYVIDGQVVSQAEAIAYANNGGNADGSNNNTPANSSEEECCGEAGAERMLRQRLADKMAERNGTSSLEEYNTLMGIEGEAGKDAAIEGILLISGEWAIVKIFQGGKWVYRAIKAKNALRAINKIASSFAKTKRIFSGQKHFSKSIADDYLSQMKNGSFNNLKELSGLLDKSGRTIITGGNHRINAAIRYGAETGNYKYLETLLNSMRITQGEAASYGYKILNVIR